MTLNEQAEKYDKLSEEEKASFLTQAYQIKYMSFREIAHITNTYPNKIRRDAKRFGIESRNKSEAQKAAITTGRQQHPTKGKTRGDDVKLKISEKRAQAWEELAPEERERLSELGRQQWQNMSSVEKEALQKAAGDAIRKASKEGSKLEKYLHKELIKAGYQVEFHKERMIQNARLQIDIWLPELTTAIEVDGPSHFSPIWGEKSLARNQKSDNTKTGLLLGSGAVIIRIKQNKSLSQKYKRDLLKNIIAELVKIDKHFPQPGNRHIILGENNE